MIDRLIIEKGQIRSEIGSSVKTAVVHKAPVERIIEPLFIPQFVRYADALSGIYVLEFEPTVHIINLHFVSPRTFVPVPWQVYICQPRNNIVQFFTRTEPLYSLDDVVNFPHISNIYRDGQPCGGVHVPLPGVGASDLDVAISHVNYIWASTFQGGFYLSAEGAMYTGAHSIPGTGGSLLPKTMTDHMGDSLMYYGGYGSGSKPYYEWLETLSPADLLKWEWTPAGRLIDLLPRPVQPQRALHLRVAAAASIPQAAHV
jgi:hypothetical protein